MLKKQNHSVLFLVRVGDDSGLISTFLWLRCSHFLDLESSVCYGMRQASALQALVSGAGCTATQMGCLATAPGTWGGTGDRVKMGCGLCLLDVSSHHASWDGHGLSSAPTVGCPPGPRGWSWLLQSQQLSLAHQSGLCESLVRGGLSVYTTVVFLLTLFFSSI